MLGPLSALLRSLHTCHLKMMPGQLQLSGSQHLTLSEMMWRPFGSGRTHRGEQVQLEMQHFRQQSSPALATIVLSLRM